MGPRFINGTGARGSQRQSASGGRGRDRTNRPGDGRPGWRKTVGPAGRAGGTSEEPREGVRLADGGGANPDLCRGRALEAGDAGARAARTDRLTDRPTEAHPAPPTPPGLARIPAPAPPPSRDSLGHPFLLHFFSASASARLPRRQCLPLARAGCLGSRQSSP